jgi:hypothetical protein
MLETERYRKKKTRREEEKKNCTAIFNEFDPWKEFK